jgi:hypothetical protein
MTFSACVQPVNRQLRHLAAAALLLLCQNGQAVADDIPLLQIDHSGPVIYCDVGPIADRKQFVRILNEGTPLTITWKLTIERVRNYLPDEEIGTVTLIRQAIPDLVTRSWQVTDSNSDISRRVASAGDAADFLATISHFPVIDRSLLKADETYVITATVHIDEGITEASWWRDLIRFGKTVASGELQLP